MNGGGQRQMVERDIAKLKSLQTLAGFSSSCVYATARYGCRDFSMAKISRTSFLAAWEIATL